LQIRYGQSVDIRRAAAQRAFAGLLGATSQGRRWGSYEATPSRRGTKIRRRLVAAAVVLAACAAGRLVSALASAPSATQAARPPRPAAAVVPGRCPKHLLPLPPEAVARAADQAHIQAFFLYRGSGPAVVVRCALAPYAGPGGGEVDAQCGMRVFGRTVAVDLLFPKMLPSRCRGGTVFCPCSAPATGCGR
jgi:hypothetical protein